MALASAALAAFWFVPPLLDRERYRGTLTEIASAGLGRPVRIEGPISLLLLPHPTISAAQVSVADAGDGASATVREMRLQVDLGALLAGRMQARDLVLRGAEMRLPWPPGLTQWGPGALQRRPPAWLNQHARVEDSTLQIGGLAVSAIDADLAVDPQTGTLSASGTAKLLDRRWRIVGRLGQVGSDGSATLDVSLDGEGDARDTGATLSGQLAGDGTLEGRVKGRGPDLSLLLAAPAMPWRASGRLSAGGGLVVASDLDLDLAGSPALGAVALRLLPTARIDAALSASRLDLDAWLPALLRGGGTALPTGLDLSAEQAVLAGGTLRRLRAGFEPASDGAVVRELDVVLPGAAALHLAGRLTDGQFRGDGRLDAPSLRETLAWLRPLAPGLVDALPPGVLHSATGTAQLGAAAGLLTLGGIAGRVDGAAVTGNLAVRPGDHPALAANLAVTGLALAAWTPPPPPDLAGWRATLAELPHHWSGFDLELVLDADRPTWHDTPLDALTLDIRVQPDGMDLRRATLKAPAFTTTASFKLTEDGRLGEGQFAATLPRAAALAPWWPNLPPALLQGAATLRATAAGEPGAMAISAAADLADTRLQATGKADLLRWRWSGSVSARHPGAPRLAEALGLLGTAPWLGDGSVSLVAQADLAPGRYALTDADLAAGSLRTHASLVLDTAGATPVLSGEITAETLPLPLPYARSPEPLPFAWLLGWQGHVAARATHLLLGQSPVLDQVAADITLQDGRLRLQGLDARLSGGHLAGALDIDPATATAPPHLHAQARITDAALPEASLGTTPDLAGGRLDGTATLDALGYSPAAILATLSGETTLTLRDGALLGVDLAAAAAALLRPDTPAIAAALAGGTTAFDRLDLAASIERGSVTLHDATLASTSGAIEATGTLDLPAAAEDLRLALRPNPPAGRPADGPRLDLRLIGPVANPRRATGMADLTRFLTQAPTPAP